MSIQLKVRRDDPLDDGAYQALLSSLQKKETTFGERLMWLFEVPEHNAEVAGFTSLSESTRANAYLWATTLNEDIRSQVSWGSDNVVGKECVLDVTIVENSKGEQKNKILRVRPVPKGD